MKKNIFFVIIGLCLMLCVGCNNTAPDPAPTNDTNDDHVSVSETTAESDTDITETIDEDVADEAETETEPDMVSLSLNEPCGNSKFQVTCTGLKQYDALEGDTYTDTPSDGNVYLVLFLSITNYDKHDLYFSPEAFSSTVDGMDCTHTFMVNDPEGYPSIFQTIPANTTADGYIVWQVPADWKELHLNYTGWAEVLNGVIDGTFTPDDLADPMPFDQL